MSKSESILNVDQAEWDRVFQINVWALMALCQAFAPGMRERGYGRIINLTSGIADQPNLAAEFKGANVLVNYLDPGWLQTDLGGKNAWFPVETVLPGALVPALLEDNGPTGRFFSAMDFKTLER